MAKKRIELSRWLIPWLWALEGGERLRGGAVGRWARVGESWRVGWGGSRRGWNGAWRPGLRGREAASWAGGGDADAGLACGPRGRLRWGRVGQGRERSRRVLQCRGVVAGLEAPGEEHVAGAAGGAEAQGIAGELLEAVAVVRRRVGRVGRRHAQQLPAEGELVAAVAAGEEAVVACLAELARQDMQEEAPDELVGGEGHRLAFVVVAVVAPVEADLAVVDGEEAVVGDGDAVGVAGEVGEDLGGAGEGRLGVDDPLGLAQGPEVAVEGGGVGERGEGAGEAQLAGAEGALELVEEESAEAAREDAHGQEEAGPAGDPAVAGGGDAAAGDDAVQVGVELQGLAPRVEDGEEAGFDAEVLGIGGDLAQGAGGGLEEDAEEGALVLQGEGGDLLREREDDMEVFAVQEFAAALVEPVGAGGPLALGAVAVAAGAVAEAAVPAAVALLDLAAESGGAAALDSGQDAPLQGGQRGGEAGAEGVAVAAQDIGDFERRAGHRRGRAGLSPEGGRGSRSSGLGEELTVLVAMCR